jgi:hypothetical protein
MEVYYPLHSNEKNGEQFVVCRYINVPGSLKRTDLRIIRRYASLFHDGLCEVRSGRM